MKSYIRAVLGWVLAVSFLGASLMFMFGPSPARSQVTGVSVATLGSVDTFIAAVLQRLSLLETQQASTSATQVQDEASMATWAAQISALTTRVQLLEAKAGTTPPVTNPPPAPGVIAINATVKTNAIANVRATPGGTLVAPVPAGTTGKVLAGPMSANGFNWWQVQFPTVTGWVGVDALTAQ